ncbi:MAG: 6-phosphogluconolactonase [Chloroflexota bacterium]
MTPTLRIFPDIQSLDRGAAELFVEVAQQAVAERGRFLVALSGGSTPNGLYRLLADVPYRSRVDWSRTHVFWGDERCVPPDDPGSNYGQAHTALLAHVPVLVGNVQRIEGEIGLQMVISGYTQILKNYAEPGRDWPRFDLILLGLGEDGHTASLFPGSPVEADSPVLAVTAQYQGRPAHRVTMTPPVINDARHVIFLVTGANKAVTLSRVLSDLKVLGELPAQRIQPKDGQITWLVDEAAAGKLKIDFGNLP